MKSVDFIEAKTRHIYPCHLVRSFKRKTTKNYSLVFYSLDVWNQTGVVFAVRLVIHYPDWSGTDSSTRLFRHLFVGDLTPDFIQTGQYAE